MAIKTKDTSHLVYVQVGKKDFESSVFVMTYRQTLGAAWDTIFIIIVGC